MALGPILIIILRLLAPLSIRRWPLWGTIACLFIDAFDIVLVDWIKLGDFIHYSQIDKALDIYYLSFAFVLSWQWSDQLAKRTSITLFIYRLVGVILFELTQVRAILFAFPNVFEGWFLFWTARNKYFAQWQLTTKRLVVVLGILLIPKLTQEYILHVTQTYPWEQIQHKIGL